MSGDCNECGSYPPPDGCCPGPLDRCQTRQASDNLYRIRDDDPHEVVEARTWLHDYPDWDENSTMVRSLIESYDDKCCELQGKLDRATAALSKLWVHHDTNVVGLRLQRILHEYYGEIGCVCPFGVPREK